MSRQGSESRQQNARRVGPALEAAYQLVLWVVPAVEKYPRSLKFTIGDRTISAALDVLDRLIAATYSRDRAEHLSAANLALERLRFFFRLASDLRVLDLRRYEHAARLIDETGRLTGGWMKADRAAKT